jgi:hypothetical protein
VISECGSIAGNTVDMLCTRQVMLHTKKHCNQQGVGCPQECNVSNLQQQNAVVVNLCPIFLLRLYYLEDSAPPFDTRQALESIVLDLVPKL